MKFLIADDEESIRWVLRKIVEGKGLNAEAASDGEQAFSLITKKCYDAVFLDIFMPGISGLDLLEKLKNIPNPPIPVVMTAQNSMKNAIDAMKKGAFDYIVKPFDVDEVEAVIEKIIKARKSQEELDYLINEKREAFQPGKTIVGKSPQIVKLFKTIGKIAHSDVTVLIEGESGTGKELVAKAIHYNSARVGKPFITVNCAAIPSELLESEFFGVEKGAFTGAVEKRTGKIKLAEGGTVFLDEIGEMPLSLQAKILRVIQEGEIEPVGGRSEKINVRIITATNKDLEVMVKQNKFREDLYFRLKVVSLYLPPLRERKEDIAPLTAYFMKKNSEELNIRLKGITKEALELFKKHNWPGNVRELENAIKRALVLSTNPVLLPEDFIDISGTAAKINFEDLTVEEYFEKKLEIFFKNIDIKSTKGLYEAILGQFEKILFKILLKKCKGNQIKTAKVLGINRNTLRKKLTEHGLKAKGED